MPSREPLVLHIGQHKTGTTAIQDYLATHPRPLAAAGVHYPKAGRVGSQHAALPAAFMSRHAHIPARFVDTDPTSVADQIAQDRRNGCVTVLSSEVWWELLTSAPDDYAAAVALLERDYDVTVVYMVRDPEEKAWSSLKHLARVGPPMDASAVLHRELATDQVTLDLLARHYPAAVRVAADPWDSVALFLSTLDSLPSASKNPKVRARLVKLAEGRRSQSAQRVNQALPHPAAVATTVASAQALWDARAFHTPRPASLEKLFARLFADAGHLPALTQLPPEAPVRAATFDHDTSTLRTFLTPRQCDALRSLWADPAVAEICRREEASDYRHAILGALDRQPL